MLQSIGKPEDSIRECTEALEIATTPALKAIVLSFRGGNFADLGKFDLAIADFKSSILLDNSNAKTFCDYGYALIKADDPSKAFTILSKAINLDPKLGQAYVNRGVALWKMGNHAEAIDDSSTGITLLPDGIEKANAFMNRANISIEVARYEKAVEDFDSAILLFSDSKVKANCFARRGIAQELLNHSADALNSYNEAITLIPTDCYTLFKRAMLRLELEDEKASDAIADLDAAVANAPDLNTKVEFLRQGAIQLAQSLLFEEAYKRFDSALLLTTNKISVMYDKGLTLTNQAKLDDAIEIFSEILNNKSSNSKALNNFGICLALQGKFNEAIIKYQEGIEIASDNINMAKLHRNLAVSLAVIGKYKEANTSLQRAKALEPKEPRNIIVKGRLEFFRGNYRKALKLHSTLPPDTSPFPVACLLAIGDKENAIVLLKSWLSAPHYPIEYLSFLNELRFLEKRVPAANGIEETMNLVKMQLT